MVSTELRTELQEDWRWMGASVGADGASDGAGFFRCCGFLYLRLSHMHAPKLK